jgi:putative FmdB family regulatory protein
MPTYDYECRQCGLRFERFQRMNDKPLKTCPDCDGPVRRLVGTGAAVIVKGSAGLSAAYERSAPRCGRQTPCCGRETPCDAPPCKE